MAMNIYGIGRLTKKPELSNYGDNQLMAKFTVAIDNNDKDNTTSFYNCVFFGKRAETLERNLSKGSRIMIIGTQTYLPYTDKDGVKHNSLNVTVRDFEFVSEYGKNQKGEDAPSGNTNNGEYNPFEQQSQPSTPAAQSSESVQEPVSDADLTGLFD